MIYLYANINFNIATEKTFILGKSKLGEGVLGFVPAVEIIDKRKILSLNFEIKDRDNDKRPSFGVISNGGNISFNDTDGKFLEYANKGFLRGNEKIEIFLRNSLSKTQEQVGAFYCYDWNYDNNDRSVSVSFKDRLEYWQEIEMPEIELDESAEPQKITKYYEDLKTLAQENGFSFVISEEEKIKQDVLDKITSSTFYRDAANLWSNFNKICEVGGFHIFSGKIGEVHIGEELNWS
jgi:hypothetical protein